MLVVPVVLITMLTIVASVSRKRRVTRRSVCGDASAHARKVERIAADLRGRTGNRPVSLRKRAVAHQVPKPRDLRHRDDKIDISDLDAILEIDIARKLCVAEPGVTFEDLVAATLPHGLVPIIVPELKTITVGGAVSGCSIESMSFRHGGFHDTCLEYEVITAGGEVLTCTADNQHRLLFQMMHGSFGTLGILSKLTFRLVPASPYVHIAYETHARLEDYLAAIERRRGEADVDFLDGIIHSPTELVLSVGRFVDRAPYTSRYDWMKIYYRSTRTRRDDYLRTADYFFRYDRGVTNVHPRSWVGRLVLGRWLSSARILRLAEKLRALRRSERPDIILDVFLPVSKVPAFLAWYAEVFAYFPLWCVPYRRVRDYEWLVPAFWAALDDELFLDLAIYGMKQTGDTNYHRLMEEKLRELGGIKTLIAHNYYREDEFWSIWNKDNYDRAKAVADPRNLFRNLYEKTCRAAMGVPASRAS
jgi:FAD/FMN-containing dehydrogenase